jgi:choline kinase
VKPPPPLDVIVLAAGRGSRLLAVGDDRPKWLLEVGGRTIADRHLAALDLLEHSRPGRLRSLTVVTGHAAASLEDIGLSGNRRLLFNAEYLTLNNWYSVLLAIRSLPADGRVVVLNGDLYGEPEWVLRFLEEAADTTEEAVLAIDFDRVLTAESMKVSRTQDGALDRIGKHEFPSPVGEYVGMLMASGRVGEAFRAQLEAFAGDPARSNEWYEGAVGRTAVAGCRWHLWPAPSSDWVEIDDVTDLQRAGELAGA